MRIVFVAQEYPPESAKGGIGTQTFAKAHGLAAARIGCLLADAALVQVLRNCQAPYPLPSPCVQLAMAGLSEPALAATRERVLSVRAERERLGAALAEVPGVLPPVFTAR